MKCLILPTSLLSLFFFTLAGAQTFTDITSSSGIGIGGGTWPSGVSLVDLDNDGDLDLFQSSHSGEATFRLNDGSGHFSSAIGTITNTELHNGYDINEDGKLDLTATVYDGNCRWWTNNSTPGAVNFTAANPNIATRQEALIDINRDGKVDWLTDGGTKINFHFGNGTGGFTVNAQNLFVFDDPNLSDDGMAPIPADLDGDGDIDLVVSWGRYEFEKGRTAIFRNDGNGNFTNVTTAAGLYQDSLAILGAGDYDGDGDIDLIGLEHNRFPHSIFLNDGTGHFTKKAGAVSGGPTGSPVYPGWGLASFTDFDNDGIGDIIVGGRQYTHVLRGTGGGNFEYKNTAWGITSSGDGNLDNTYAFGDIDNDGDLDIAVLPSNRTNILYRNDLPAKNWLNVRPVGLAGNKGAAGAKIRIYENGTTNRLWFEQVILHSKQAQQNYYGFAQTERHFGLGTRTICDVKVEFYPSGTKVLTTGVPNNVTVVINENGTASHGTVGIVKPEGQRPKAEEMRLDEWLKINLSKDSDVNIALINCAGRLVMSLHLSAGSFSTFRNSLKTIPAGSYLVLIKVGTIKKAVRIIAGM